MICDVLTLSHTSSIIHILTCTYSLYQNSASTQINTHFIIHTFKLHAFDLEVLCVSVYCVSVFICYSSSIIQQNWNGSCFNAGENKTQTRTHTHTQFFPHNQGSANFSIQDKKKRSSKSCFYMSK